MPAGRVRQSLYNFFSKTKATTRSVIPRLSRPFLEAVEANNIPSEETSPDMSSNPIRRASATDSKGGVQSHSANYAVCSAGFFFVAAILFITSLAANMNWIEGSLGFVQTSIVSTNGITTETKVYRTTTVIGTLNYVQGSTYQTQSQTTSNSNPNPTPSPSPNPVVPRPPVTPVSNPAGLNGGYAYGAYGTNMCATPVMDGDLICAGLLALWRGAGWITTLEVGLLMVSALGFVCAYGLSRRLTAASTPDSDPAAKNARGPGRYAWLCGLRLDQAFTLLIVSLFGTIMGAMFIISWPSSIATAFNNFNAYAQSQINPASLSPANSYSWFINPAPAAGYYIAFTGSVCVFIAFFYSFLLYGASLCGKGGCLDCLRVPPTGAGAASYGATAVASPLHAAAGGAVGAPAGSIAVGGGAYLSVPSATPSKPGDERAAFAPSAEGGVPMKV